MTRKKYSRDNYWDSSPSSSTSDSEDEFEELTEKDMEGLDSMIFDFIDKGKYGDPLFNKWNYVEPHPNDMMGWCYPNVIPIDGRLIWFTDLLTHESMKHLSRFAMIRQPIRQPTHTAPRLNLSVKDFKLLVEFSKRWLHINGVYPDKTNILWCMSKIIESTV
tara:strand:- start:1717 stop:2202 length:486 start_codon:yes stop_codon:yes gene_type:complete